MKIIIFLRDHLHLVQNIVLPWLPIDSGSAFLILITDGSVLGKNGR